MQKCFDKSKCSSTTWFFRFTVDIKISVLERTCILSLKMKESVGVSVSLSAVQCFVPQLVSFERHTGMQSSAQGNCSVKCLLLSVALPFLISCTRGEQGGTSGGQRGGGGTWRHLACRAYSALPFVRCLPQRGLRTISRAVALAPQIWHRSWKIVCETIF